MTQDHVRMQALRRAEGATIAPNDPSPPHRVAPVERHRGRGIAYRCLYGILLFGPDKL